MRGTESHFQATPWSLVYHIQTGDDTRRRLLLENLTTTYWKPVYCYLRKKGYSDDQAQDLTQGFFCEIIFGRNLVEKADQAKGRFRTFLLVALERFLVTEVRRETRIKRGGDAKVQSLDVSGLRHSQVAEAMETPDEAFYYVWITQLLDQALEEVKHEYYSTQRESHWDAFCQRLLTPIMTRSQAPSLSEVCECLEIETPIKASNMIETVKRRFRTVLKRHLKALTRDDAEAEEEFAEILGFLSNRSA